MSGTCAPGHYVESGSVGSKVHHYIDPSCFTGNYPVVGDDGIATGFGNSLPGIVEGPGQKNVDAALSKNFGLCWHSDTATMQFRAEAFNLRNTPQFSDPDTGQAYATFGEIQTAAAAPRILQFALKLNF